MNEMTKTEFCVAQLLGELIEALIFIKFGTILEKMGSPSQDQPAELEDWFPASLFLLLKAAYFLYLCRRLRNCGRNS